MIMNTITQSPKSWRQQQKMTMAGVASMLGIKGKNPSRTWQRYETGEREPPVAVMAKLETISEGQVTTTAWMYARKAYLARKQEALP
ncbi:helix-turn-helix domain-containing protein [Rhizobium sp. GR12]|uniref:helix-turn-helix domain-containing protein n=1 Tax=Rhizobium sp. GR12 TaxID=3053925 RepID=UPI002FBDC39B